MRPAPPKRQRLDDVLVERELCENKSQARALIMAGRVIVNDQKQQKAGAPTRIDANVEIIGEISPFVSRGGHKLDGALQQFSALKVRDRIALDIGASTGGFTDCLLQRGAKKVYAVDVGYGQLAWKLRADPRVVNMERTNFRYVEKGAFAEPIELCVADLSFISLDKILEPLTQHLAPGADCVLLIKPQFEVGREEASAHAGVIKDEALRQAAIERILTLATTFQFAFIEGADSTLPGPKGNVEYLAWLRYEPKPQEP